MLFCIAFFGARAFLDAEHRLNCLDQVLSEVPLGGEQLLSEVGKELATIPRRGQSVVYRQAGRRGGRSGRLNGTEPVHHVHYAVNVPGQPDRYPDEVILLGGPEVARQGHNAVLDSLL